jgi:hypothetical protein
MSKKRLESEILYYANKREGISTYEKTPCPTKECFETIGQKGIDFIVNKIRKMVKMRIYMSGNGKPEYYGLPSPLSFAHIPSCSIITVSDYPYQFQKKDLQYPELFDKEHFVIDAESVKGRISEKTLKRAPRGRAMRKKAE